MNNKSNGELLNRIAQRASHRAFFVASTLSTYQNQEQIGEAELAAFLGCSPQNLPKLALCRRPDSSASSFRDEVKQIAKYAGVSQVRLAQLFRRVESITALQSAPSSPSYLATGAFLVAARDRVEDETVEEQSEAGILSDSELKSDLP